jgi:hypothetical protein
VPSSGEQPSSAQSHATVLVNCPFATTDIVFCVKNEKNDLMKMNRSKNFLTMTIWMKKQRLQSITHLSEQIQQSGGKDSTLHYMIR